MKKRNKKYTPKPRRVPAIVRTARVFGPLHDIMEQLEREGTLTTSPKGVPMFFDIDDNAWYATAPALFGLIEHLEMYGRRRGVQMPLDSLKQFHKRIDYGMPIDAALMDRLKAEVALLQRAMAYLSVHELTDLFRQCQIKFELEGSTDGHARRESKSQGPQDS